MAKNVDELPPAEKLMQARTRLLITNPFYGALLMEIDFLKSDMAWASSNCRTMGVRIKSNKRVELVWNPEFVGSQTLKQVCAALMHEVEHIVHCHCIRMGNRNPIQWNIATDMVVNGTKSNPRIGYVDENKRNVILPLDGNIVFIPKGWDENGTSEQFYKLVDEDQNDSACDMCDGTGQVGSDGDGQGEEGEQGKHGDNANSGENKGGNESHQDGSKPCPKCHGSGQSTQWGVVFDDHSSWRQSEVSRDDARQIVKEIVKSASTKSQGKVPGHLVEAIAALEKAQIPWRQKLRRYIGKYVGGHRTTWSRINRRRSDEFGIKGVSHHATGEGVVIMDTSGSIGETEAAHFWAEIESMITRVKIGVLQWDAEYQDWWPKYKRYDWKKIKLKGRGGTDMAAPIDWLIKNGKVPRSGPVIMLTDGYCNYHAPCDFPFICVITNESGAAPAWGEVVRLKLID